MHGLSIGGLICSIFAVVKSETYVPPKRCYNLAMATTHALVALNSSTAVKLTPEGTTHSGVDITIQNPNDYGYIYIGGTGVTTSNYGFRILPNHSIAFELLGKDHIFAVASTSLNAAVITVALEDFK